ncbi:FG-GAP-like repeat-containing protein [Streptomyces sp. HNM0645]|uniref:FG-GAP-like repeat-containing protein n=1 Tax=Streptomyces sp. HNM0645 TaxID=2782343 RepID=UPI0024B6F2DA|nr:FG-GAP-like repeat-containing protein [Streptomyces sp. HNM0645]MDI9883932.1 FG-GAP-like repeat-containing protein [Streptomyces sp. HNM0645]
MRLLRNAALTGAAALLLAPLAGCGLAPPSRSGPERPAAPRSAPPRALAGQAAPPALPVPRGGGSPVPEDFNGDGHRDLVLNDLVKAPGAGHDDDAGIGIVYGTGGGTATASAAKGPVSPAVRQLLSPRANGAPVAGTLPAAFDAAAACDLDGDGFSDLVVVTDPPYDGTGRPPVPLQLLFGGPSGLTGRAVVLRIPERARYGNEWPDHPVCGDFDGDGAQDLAVTASEGRVSFLRGPFGRTGAPRAAAAAVPGAGPVLAAPTPRPDTDGDGYDDLVHATGPLVPGTEAECMLLRGGPDGPGRPGGPYRFKAVPLPPAPPLPTGETAPVTELLRRADFDGDGHAEIVTRTHRGENADVIAVHPGAGDRNRPLVTFSTSVFLG